MDEILKKDEAEIKEEVNNESTEEELMDVGSFLKKADDGAQNDSDVTDAEGDTLTPTEDNLDSGEMGNETANEDVVHDEGMPNVEGEIETEPVEKMIAQSKVNEIAAKARQEGRDSALKELLTKYGVGSDTELDDLFGKGQAFVDLDNEYNIQRQSYSDALAENALLKTRINQDRWEDVKLILGGKGLEITPENIETYLVSHPEWRTTAASGSAGGEMGGQNILTPEMGKQLAQNIGSGEPVEQKATLRKLGNEASPEPALSEEEMARKLYGFK